MLDAHALLRRFSPLAQGDCVRASGAPGRADVLQTGTRFESCGRSKAYNEKVVEV
jgi:hypothetical protein